MRKSANTSFMNRVESLPESFEGSSVRVSNVVSLCCSEACPILRRTLFALRGPHCGQSQHLQVTLKNRPTPLTLAEMPSKVSLPHFFFRYGSLGVSQLFCIESSEGGTAPAALMRAPPSNSRPFLLRDRGRGTDADCEFGGQADGFRPPVAGVVGSHPVDGPEG